MRTLRAPKKVRAYNLAPGDIILVKNKTFISKIISFGELIRFHRDTWSHVAIVVGNNGDIIEARWNGVKKGNITKYDGVEYLVVKTSETILEYPIDLAQALAYLSSQVNKSYGYLTLIGTATRFLIPGRGFAFIGSHNICSGLAAQALTRGPFIPNVQPVTMSPSELAISLGVTTR